MVVCSLYDHAARVRSYEMVAEVYPQITQISQMKKGGVP
jgi:hypothetical protein